MSDTTTLPVRREWTITLDPPVEIGGMTCSELRLREPTAQEMGKALGLLGSNQTLLQRHEMQMSLVSQVAGVSRLVLDRVPYATVLGAANWLEGFSQASPPTPPS